MKSHSKRILSLVFALLMAFQQVMFAAQTVDLLTPAEQTQTVDLLTGEEENKTVDLLTPAEPSAPIEQPIEQSKPIIEENKETENQTVDLLTPGDDEVVPEEGKKSTTTILIGGEEEEETQDDSWDLTPAEITVPEENHDEEEKKDATFEDEEHHENAGVLPWGTDLVKPWSIYREPKKVYRPGEDLDLTELLVEIKTGRSGSLYNIEDLINDEFTTITRTRKSDGEKVRLDDKIYEDETMTIHMDGCQDLTIDFTVDENLKDEEEALEAFQDNLIREEFRDGLDFSLYLIKKGERKNPIVAYSLDPHKLTPIGNGVDKKLKDGPLFDLKDINTWDRFDIETLGKVKAILERSAEIKNIENVRKKLITQLAIWNVTSNIIPREIDATVSEIEENETTELGPELKPTDEEAVPEEREEEPIEIIDPTTPEEEIESVKQDDEGEAVEEKAEIEEKTETEETAEDKTEAEEPVEENTQKNKESEKIEEQAPVQSTVHKIVFDVRDIDLPYNEVELSDEEYALYNELTSLEAIELKSEDEDLKIYEPIIEETENPYADLVTIGESDIDFIERVETEVTFDAVDYSFQNLYHTLETSSMLGFGQPRDFNVLLKATMKASRKIVEGDKFEVEILSKTLPILNGEEGRANDIQIDGKVVATAEYIAEENKIVYTFVEDLDTDKVEIEQEFKQIKEEKAALLNMLDVSENLVLDAVRGAEGDEDFEENPDELEISPEFEENLIQLKLGNTPVQYNGVSFETKKFRLKTTMTAKAAPVWQIPVGWTFDVKIGEYLKPDPDNPLKPLYDPNKPSVEVATPSYDAKNHVIKYTFIKPLNNTKTFNIDQLLAFDTDKIANREEIEINIVIAPKNYKVQKMPTIKVRKDDPRSEIISQFVVENKQDLYKVVYPYMVSYVSRQSVNNGTVTWDIDVDTSTLKREGLDYNSIALSLYIPNKQGLSDYKVYVDETEGAFNTIGDLVLFNKTIAKDSIPDNLKIKVQAQTSVERDAYSLGIRITPDIGYIQKLRDELKQKIKDKNSILGPLLTWIEFIEDPNNSKQFDNGFNLLDTRITAIAPPENGSERAVGYNDPLRSFYLNKTNNGKVDIKFSETIDLKNINADIGDDIYTDKIESIKDSIGISTQFLSIIERSTPVVKIYIPKKDGSYEMVPTTKNGKPKKEQFNSIISDLRKSKRLLPGTIIEYDYSATYVTGNEFISMGIDLNKREVYNEQLMKYTEANKFAEAKLINIGNKQDTYRVGKYVFKSDDEKYNKYVLFKIIETGENGYCINPGIQNPTGNTHFHKKVVVEPGEGLIALENAIDKYDKKPRNYTGVALLKRLKKIFFYYDKYEREHNLDVINDEDTKYQIRNARQAAIFDAVCNKGKDFLDQGFNNGGAYADAETRRYYDELNDIIDNEPDLTEEQLNSVTITLYPVADNKRIQNIITGEVENPVYIEKVGQDGEPLFGAEFVIIQNGIEVKRWISDGQAKELYLEPGEYILRETKAPDGYKEIEDVSFIVDKIVTVNDIKISRTDTFNKYYSSQERYTDNVIKIESNDNITISSDGHTLKAINKKNSFKLRKVDGTDESKLLKNAEFALYKIIDSGNSTTREEFVETRTTDESGEIEFAGLDTGSYILKENMAPEGYKKIDEFLYVDVQKNGDISFRDANKNGSKEMNYYEVITGTPIQKKVKETQLISKTEHPTIEYHGRFKDYLNIKTQVISQDINTVKSRIILNPSTDSTNGKGPDQPTYLTLTKKEANKLKYTVYKVSASEKGMLNNNTGFNRAEFYADGEIKGTSKEIFFDTTPSRWGGDAYVVDVTAFYDEQKAGESAERNISYTWGNKPTAAVAENYLAGEVGATVKFIEKEISIPTPPTVKVKNYKTYDFKVEKIDSKVDENGNLIHLQGAEFTLYEFSSKEETERKVVKTVTTDENGIAEFKDIKIGKYILKETKAPDGYHIINTPVIVNISKDGEITFNSNDASGALDENVFKFIPATEKTEENKIFKSESVEEYPNIKYTGYTDFMNVKTKLVSSEPTTVKTRIFLNPSTDSKDGKGPNEYTTLDLKANNAQSASYTIYKVSEDVKSSIEYNTPLGNDLIYTHGDFKDGLASIGFKTYGKNVEPGKPDKERWQGDAYIVDITAKYKPDVNKKYVHFNWKFCRDGINIETNIEGNVGAKSGYVTETVTNKTIPTLQVKNSKGTNFKVLKVDADNKNVHLKDAEFTLYDETGSKEIQKVVTDENGVAEFKGVGVGKYVVVETKAPTGYDKSDKTWHIEVVNEDGKYKVFLYGKPTQEISGYRFNHTEPYKTEFTDFNGINYLNVITELKRAENKEGFYLNITLEKNYNYRNYYTGYYIPYKGKLSLTFDNNNFKIYDASSNQPLSDNSVVINDFDCQSYGNQNVYEMNYYIEIKKIFNVESGPLTSVRFDTNYSGWYNYVLDEAIPKLVPVYKTNDNKTELKNSKEISFTVENTPIKRDVKFVKVNSEGTALIGAKFKLLKNNNGKFNVVVEEGITSGNGGEIQIKNLEVGEYRLEETEAPSNYTKLNGTAIQFRITEDGKTEVYFKGNYVDINDINNKIVNYKKGKGKFKLNKIDEEGTALKDVKFKLRDKTTNAVISELKSNENGEINFQGLEPGEYTLEETEALSGYKKSEYTWTVKVYDTGYTVVKANPRKLDEKIHKPSDVGKKLTVSNFNFKVKDKPDTEKIILPNRNQFFEFSYTLTPNIYGENGIKEGDFFTTQYSPYIKRQGTIETFIPDDIIIDQGLLAIANYNEKENKATYTFTKLIEDLPKDVSFSIKESLNVNREAVPFDNKGDIEFINNVAGKNLNCEKYKVSYKLYGDESLENADYIKYANYFLVGGTTLNSTVSISSFINNINYKTSKVNFVSYINFNNLNPNNFKIVLSNMQGAIINSQKSDIKVYKVISGNPSQSFSSIYNANNLTFNKEVDTTINYANNLNLAEIKINDFSENSRYIIELNTPFDSINDFAKIKARVDCDNPPYCSNAYVETFSHIVTKPNETSGEGGVVSPDLIVVNQKVKHPDIEFKKIDGKDKDKKVLEGAEFTLYKAEEDGQDKSELKFGMVNKDFKFVKDEKNAYTVTSNKEGKFKFEKLEDGIYAIKETKAPKDYALLTKYAFFFKVEGGKITQVDETGNVVKVDGKDHVVVDITLEEPTNEVIEIENFKAEYPSTGGVGALPFVFIGMMIMMVGAYMFIRRRDALYE